MISCQLYELSLPYFKLHGSEPKYDNNKEYYETLSKILNNKNTDLYLKSVFYKSFTEVYYPKAITPKTLVSNWAISKYIDYKMLASTNSLSPENLDILAVEKWKSFDKRDIFDTKYTILPLYLKDIREWKIPLVWCVVNPKFWNMYYGLDKDVREEFFYTESLYELKSAVNKNICLYQKIKEYI